MSNDKDTPNNIITIYDADIPTDKKIVEIAKTSHSMLSPKSIEFINGKRKIRLRDINKSVRKKHFLRALVKSHGVISDACTAMGVARQTVYNWMANDPEFENMVALIEDETIDFAESKLFENINKGFEASLIFFLKTRGKRRGYVEQGDGAGRSELQKRIEESTDDELLEQIRALEEKTGSSS